MDITPVDIEECLLKHPYVNEAIAFGISVNDFEQVCRNIYVFFYSKNLFKNYLNLKNFTQEICAWVRLKSSSNSVETTANELIQFCLGDKDLADYKVPKYIKIVKEFPVNNMGKYVRNKMAEQYKKELNL